LTAGQVVFAAGTLGTQRLLLAARERGDLPALSARLGELTRTNSESILGATRFRPDRRVARGVAITSSFYPDGQTHVEAVRYGRGSNLMALISAAMTDGGGRLPRWLKYLWGLLVRPHHALAMGLPWRWSERTMIVLVMQARDNSLTVSLRRGPFGLRWLTSRQGHGDPNPSWIPAGNDAVRRIAARIGGYPGGSVGDIADIPMTAHILGGAPIGADPSSGVIDGYQRVFGYEGLHVVDGAAISANLGANPSLTITAQAERAMSFWPNKGEPDPRPTLGQPYRRVDPRPPARPAVPADAPGVYRIGGAVAARRR
jgi:cholesterol oxidase